MSNETGYKLIFDGLYRWSRNGVVAKELSGGFSRQREAFRALEAYRAKLNPVSGIESDASIEGLTSKADLLKWAENNGTEVPEKLKQPSAIKKFLMGKKD
jgi:hypothetical protein